MKVAVASLESRFDNLKPKIRRWALQVVQALKLKSGYVEIYLVGGRLMGKNVLAFPAPKGFFRPDVKEKPLGEIYLNPAYIKQHREDLGYMLIHGFLHILGYDHKKKSDRIKMERKERQLCKILF